MFLEGVGEKIKLYKLVSKNKNQITNLLNLTYLSDVIISLYLIKQKYNYQSNIDIKDYKLDLNSRTITKNNQNLKLTQKEIDIIIFLNGYEKPQKVNVLQNKVWGYSLEMETHTVETHIYRLRKKILDIFKDEKFIISHDDGYLIK